MFLILHPLNSHAEYRAFLLKISKKPARPPASTGLPASADQAAPKAPKGEEQDFRLVKSSLDPYQYPTYYPIAQDEMVQYVQTWMCRGRTNDAPDICEPPLPPIAQQTVQQNSQQPALPTGTQTAPATNP